MRGDQVPEKPATVHSLVQGKDTKQHESTCEPYIKIEIYRTSLTLVQSNISVPEPDSKDQSLADFKEDLLHRLECCLIN